MAAVPRVVEGEDKLSKAANVQSGRVGCPAVLWACCGNPEMRPLNHWIATRAAVHAARLCSTNTTGTDTMAPRIPCQ